MKQTIMKSVKELSESGDKLQTYSFLLLVVSIVFLIVSLFTIKLLPLGILFSLFTILFAIDFRYRNLCERIERAR